MAAAGPRCSLSTLKLVIPSAMSGDEHRQDEGDNQPLHSQSWNPSAAQPQEHTRSLRRILRDISQELGDNDDAGISESQAETLASLRCTLREAIQDSNQNYSTPQPAESLAIMFLLQIMLMMVLQNSDQRDSELDNTANAAQQPETLASLQLKLTAAFQEIEDLSATSDADLFAADTGNLPAPINERVERLRANRRRVIDSEVVPLASKLEEMLKQY